MSTDIKPYDHQEHLDSLSRYHRGVANFCLVVGVLVGLGSAGIIWGMFVDPDAPIPILIAPTGLMVLLAVVSLIVGVSNHRAAKKATKGAPFPRTL